ncbi:RagB/SusD family nutrient uptake outer membrane protein [uncultured Bacteroides sp.]|uniref:RagB/SusD family nutrient uptake outer membrane protein n=1 Tax=uncultured Bacteroides sp. TaxID=162156 RepID=UPI0025F9AD52|nr:RagB/SusD family nutrient uptake outer membrane protein [uncultured Bacteroides sp.]
MKKLLYLLPILLLLTSCEDFLDTKLLTEKTTENFPETEKDANQMLTSIYAKLLFEDPETSSEYYTAQLASDDCLGGNLSYSGNCATNFLLYQGNLNSRLGIWDRCYQLINHANNTINTLDNVKSWSSESERLRHFGEAYFLRAWAYYELVKIFGGVPLRTTIEAVNLPRASVDEVYALIASDIKNAIEMMPNRIYPAGNAMAGHATKYAAEAFAARVFLFYTGRYDKKTLPLTEGEITKEQIIKWLEDCINNSGHALVSDQRNLWAYTNSATNSSTSQKQYSYAVKHKLAWEGNSSIETLFANKHNLTSTWTYTWFANTCAMFYSPSGDDADWKNESYPFNFGWGAGPVSPGMVQDWKEWSNKQTFLDGYTEDPRISGSIWSYKAMDPNNEGNILGDFRLDDSEPAYTVSYRYYEQTGYFNKKYININAYNSNGVLEAFGKTLHPGISSQTSPQLLNIADLIHIRFADVLLMHSELTGDATGLNKVRQRSHLAPVSYTLDALKQERRWEFAFESIRWWDMLRWSGPSLEEAGNALNRQTGFDIINAAAIVPMVKYDYKKRLQATQGYWPIPQIEIDRSNGMLEQNPGWGPEAQFSDWTKM